MKKDNVVSRRDFIATGAALTGAMVFNPLASVGRERTADKKQRIAIIGTGGRAMSSMWSKDVVDAYPDTKNARSCITSPLFHKGFLKHTLSITQ